MLPMNVAANTKNSEWHLQNVQFSLDRATVQDLEATKMMMPVARENVIVSLEEKQDDGEMLSSDDIFTNNIDVETFEEIKLFDDTHDQKNSNYDAGSSILVARRTVNHVVNKDSSDKYSEEKEKFSEEASGLNTEVDHVDDLSDAFNDFEQENKISNGNDDQADMGTQDTVATDNPLALNAEAHQECIAARESCISVLKGQELLEGDTSELCASLVVVGLISNNTRLCKVCVHVENTLKMLKCDQCVEAFHVPRCDDENKEEVKREVLKQKFEGLYKVIIEILGVKVEKIVASDGVVDSPYCLVTGEYRWTANMERIMKAQALRDSSMVGYMSSNKNIGIYSMHPGWVARPSVASVAISFHSFHERWQCRQIEVKWTKFPWDAGGNCNLVIATSSRADFIHEPVFSWTTRLPEINGILHAMQKPKLLDFSKNVFIELEASVSFMYMLLGKSSNGKFYWLVMWRVTAKALKDAIYNGTPFSQTESRKDGFMLVIFDPGPHGRALLNGNPNQQRALELFLRFSDVLLLSLDAVESLTGIKNPIRAFKVSVVDTVGCEDSYIATIAFGFLRKMPGVNILALANDVGATTVTGNGAGRNVTKLDRIMELLRLSNISEDAEYWREMIDGNMEVSEVHILFQTTCRLCSCGQEQFKREGLLGIQLDADTCHYPLRYNSRGI